MARGPDADAPPDARPRILCLHGGGTNATVLRLQCRALASALAPHFRLVFADAPLTCAAHADIVAVYGDCGPFRCWMRWHGQPGADDAGREAADEAAAAAAAASAIVAACRAAMDADAGSGPWAALLGFSQGAKVAASLLWAQERAAAAAAPPPLPAAFGFAVLVAGSPPLVALDAAADAAPAAADAIDEGEPVGDVGRGPDAPRDEARKIKVAVGRGLGVGDLVEKVESKH